ncbi:hypothetical protein NU219Hw_g7555t1 [Hortaea werneckii]
MATNNDLPPPELDDLSTEFFPVGRSLTFEGQILQAQNIAIMTMLQDIRRTLHQGQAEASASGAPTRTPRATPRVSKESGTVSGAVSADETTKSLVAPTPKWLAEGSKKANSDNHRKLYKLTNTDGARVMARKWYEEVASLSEDRAWGEDTIQKYFKLVSKSAEQAAKEEGGGTHADGKDGKAKRGRKKATNDSTRKRATPEDHHSDTSPSCARPPKVSKQSYDTEDEDPKAVAVARRVRRIHIVDDDEEEDEEEAECY